MRNHYDLLVIGAGAAGSTAATSAAGNGAHVALIERDKIGGTCLNYGCDPTKTLLHSAATLYHARHADRHGLRLSPALFDWGAVEAYTREVINRIRGGTSDEASADMAKKGIEIIKGEASFVSPHAVSVLGQTITAERIIVASGSQTLVPPIEGLEKAGFITNVEAVALSSLPRRLAIVGGGAIGMEFAQMYHRFGVSVTVLERSSYPLDKEDRELAAQLCDLLIGEGIHIETEAELQHVQSISAGKKLRYCCKDGPQQELVVDEILLALGRRPTLEKLNLEAIGVKTGKKGIAVDEYLRTSVPHILAAGDVTGGLQFTHVAYQQGKVAVYNAFADHPQPFDGSVIPWVTYTDPPLAHVGKTEEQLREQGIEYRVGRMKFNEVERAITMGQTAGLVKLLVDAQDNILGGHILGARADDLLAPIIIAMQAKIPVKQLASTIIPYPTLSEAVRWAADRL